MRSITAATQTQADSGELIEQGALLFDFASGLYGFWTGQGPWTYNSTTYQSGGSLFEIEPLREVAGLEAIAYTLRLRAIPNTDLSPDKLDTIFSETYHRRPIVIDAVYADPDDPLNELSVEREFSGYVDQIAKVEEGGESYLEARLESKDVDNHKRGYRVRSDQDQQRVGGANDRFLRHSATSPTEPILWGR